MALCDKAAREGRNEHAGRYSRGFVRTSNWFWRFSETVEKESSKNAK
jgi:hypothetical protein